MKHNEQIAPGKVIDITEVFDTTPERLFKAWTDEKDFAAWFGPEDFQTTYCKLDLRVDGSWKTCIVDKDGNEYWMEGKYMEIIKSEKLVFTFNNDGGEHIKADEETRVTITFSKSGSQTAMHFSQSVFKTVELRNGHNEGWLSTLICLRIHISKSK